MTVYSSRVLSGSQAEDKQPDIDSPSKSPKSSSIVRNALAQIGYDMNKSVIHIPVTPKLSRSYLYSDDSSSKDSPSDTHNRRNDENITWTVSPHPSSDNDISYLESIKTSTSELHSDDVALSATSIDPATELLLRYNSQLKPDSIASYIQSSNSNLGRPHPIAPLRRATSTEPQRLGSAKKRRRSETDPERLLLVPTPTVDTSAAPAAPAVSAVPIDVSDTDKKDSPVDDFDNFDFDSDDFGLVDQIEASRNSPALSQDQSLAPVKPVEVKVEDEFDSLDENFDQEEMEDIMAKLETCTHQTTTRVSDTVPQTRYRRFLVQSVKISEYTAKNDYRPVEKIIEATDEAERLAYIVKLREDWYDTAVSLHDYIHVIGVTETSGQLVVDNAAGLIIVNPDYLVSCTVVADHFLCGRRSVLEQRVRNPSDVNKSTVYGTLIHELFQACMKAKDFTDGFMENVVDSVIPQHVEKLFFLDESIDKAKNHIRDKYGLIRTWARKFVSATDEVVSPSTTVVEVLDAEEHIWSPMYGLKGSIDMTVIARLDGQSKCTVPFEIKTGRNSKIMSHRAQTILYTLLLSDRYDEQVLTGVLYYLDLVETINVPVIGNDVRGLIIGRNAVAAATNDSTAVIPMSKRPMLCHGCFSSKACLVYHKALEDGTAESSNLGEWFDEQTSHLHQREKEFLRHWDRLLTLEETSMTRFRQEIWLMTERERDSVGRCFSCLQVESMLASTGIEHINRYVYKFSRRQSANIDTSFLEYQINVGDPIVVSDSQGHLALAAGFLKELTADSVTVSVDRQFDANYYTSTMASQNRAHYRVDKDEFSNGMAMVRNNLVQLLAKDGVKQTRELIVNLETPQFKCKLLDSHRLPVGELNCDQVRALEKVLTASDYALIMGMPGTGKTTTISHIIKALLAQNKTILLASYTHTAVDNILLKVRDHCTKVLRLGQINKIHPEVRKFASLQQQFPESFEELKKFYYDSQIVATTCLGINSYILQRRRFDYCIIDEASQITLPVCIGPLRFADRFVLVGDHNQLSPLVQNKEARSGGLDASLFKLLSESQPSAVVTLEHQYRMCEDIMALSNTLIYNGRLKCGNEKVARRTLPVPLKKEALHKIHRDSGSTCETAHCWISHLLDEKLKVVFVNTDSVPAHEIRKEGRVQNEVEASLVKQFAESLVLSGVPEQSIGIISVYRAQSKLLSHAMKGHPDIELQTVDKFQGRDKECVLISLVRSNDELKVGDLLTDWRRLNVTFTRARSKLVIFGSKRTLMTISILAKFFDLISEKRWVYNVPADAHLMHPRLLNQAPRLNDENNGRTARKALVKLGSSVSGRPVLRDILNDIRQ
ncbi:hypothetical protein V1512DRAFT_261556 [Lipomyces arxii]|uniref:uncharacterized protein n=1 Tax=Lipomyces arxii TaxID=56418 RepID=UPI0034CFB25B